MTIVTIYVEIFKTNVIIFIGNVIRYRPFNLKGGGYGFLFRSEIFFWTTQELEYLYFLSCKARIFFPEFNIRLYYKNSESNYFFFPPPKSEYFVQQHQNIFLEKNHNPPLQVKWSFPNVFDITLTDDFQVSGSVQ